MHRRRGALSLSLFGGGFNVEMYQQERKSPHFISVVEYCNITLFINLPLSWYLALPHTVLSFSFQLSSPEPIALFQAPEFECITPGHRLCTLILHCCHPIPDGGRKKSVSGLGGVEAIGIAKR